MIPSGKFEKEEGEISPPRPSAPYNPELDIVIKDNEYILLSKEDREAESIDVCVLYLSAFLAFLVPPMGLVYMCCFNCCCTMNYVRWTHRKKRAHKMIFIATLLGIIVYVITGMVMDRV